MSRSEHHCDSCGAPYSGFICEHCGKLAAHLESAADENRALDEFHRQLQKLKPHEQSQWLLESGFLPDNREVLIEAGIYCVPFLKNSAIYDAAASRLEAIILKLKLTADDPKAERAVQDFQAHIKQYKTDKRTEAALGMGCLLTILALTIAGGWWLIKAAGVLIGVPLIIVGIIIVIYLLVRK
jgi:hypothetical protein